MLDTIMSYIPEFLKEYLRAVCYESSVEPVTRFIKDMLYAIDVALPYLILVGCLLL